MWKSMALALLIVAVQAAGAERAGASISDAASAWATTLHGAVRLIAAVDAVGENASVPIAMQFRMNPGWHIYWRSPGDAGYPPQTDWSRSENLASAEVSWPAPRRISVSGFETIGYEAAVILPIAAKPQHPGQPLALRAIVNYLACADICVPYVAELSLDLPAGEAHASWFAQDISRANAQVPRRDSAHGLAVAGVRLTGPELVVVVRSTEPLRSPDVFVEAPAPLAFGIPRVSLAEDGRAADLIVPVHNSDADRKSVV